MAPIYNLVLLEYELQRKSISCVTDQTVGEYNPPESEDELRLEAFEADQPDLTRQVTNYFDTLKVSDPLLAEAAKFSIFDALQLLNKQAEKVIKPTPG